MLLAHTQGLSLWNDPWTTCGLFVEDQWTHLLDPSGMPVCPQPSTPAPAGLHATCLFGNPTSS
ncbi:MAG: hypothetical protein ACJAZO_003878 [Myxococcota bacterium]|jgi:hypothetical protein